ncbi:MAG: hypothetical protein R3C44_23365 [Chloroflexota bacterium]
MSAIEELGELDNTPVIYILGDNGSSAEGSLNGTPNELMNSMVDTGCGKIPCRRWIAGYARHLAPLRCRLGLGR